MQANIIRSGSVLLMLLLNACSGDSADTSDQTDDASADAGTTVVVDVNPFNFDGNALVRSVATENCTLTNGTTTSCYRIEITGVPSNHDVGVFCPRDIYASAEEGGIWFDGSGTASDIDGSFITSLATRYNDDKWLLYNPSTGLVNVTDTYAKCDGAARPNVATELQNHCVECAMEYVNGGVSQSYLIPITPTKSSQTTAIGNNHVGVALSGVVLAPPAPVSAILGAYTIAAFDDCAGHINLVDGYHYHGAANCSFSVQQNDDHAPLFGYAMDGFGIYEMLDAAGSEPTDLDNCRGHSDDTRGYHYHTASVGENMFIGCYSGLQAVQ